MSACYRISILLRALRVARPFSVPGGWQEVERTWRSFSLAGSGMPSRLFWAYCRCCVGLAARDVG